MLRSAPLLAVLLTGCGAPKCADCNTSELCDEKTGECIYAGPAGGGGGSSTGGGTPNGGGGGSAAGGGSGSVWTDPDAGSPDAGCLDTWANYTGGWFSSSCSSCHGATWNYTTVSGYGDTLACLIAGGSMPPGGASQVDRDRIVAWFRCGAPQ